MLNHFWKFREKYENRANLAKAYLKYIIFYLSLGIIILAFCPWESRYFPDCVGCMSKSEISLVLLKLFNGFTFFIIAVVAVVYVIGKLFSWLTMKLFSIFSFLKIFKKKNEITPLQAIVGLLVCSHLAYAILCSVIIFS